MRRLRVRLLHKSRIIEIPSPSMSIVVDQTMNDIQEKWIRSPRKMKSLVVMTICVLPLFFHICSCQYPLSPPSFIVKSELPHPHVSLCWRNRECCFSFFLIVHTLPRIARWTISSFPYFVFLFRRSNYFLFSSKRFVSTRIVVNRLKERKNEITVDPKEIFVYFWNEEIQQIS